MGLSIELCQDLDDLGENDNQREQHQGLDKREAENQRQLNRRTRSRVAGHCLASRSTHLSLTQTGQAGGDRDAEAGSDSYIITV
jgi:hypothetical protein